jgi:hypothetical protein
VVTGVKVTATNAGTNVPTKTVSNHDGIYVLPNPFPGQYSIEFVRSGFETILCPAVTLNSTEVARRRGTQSRLSQGHGHRAQRWPCTRHGHRVCGHQDEGDCCRQSATEYLWGGRFVEDFAVEITPGYSLASSPYGTVVKGGQWFTKDFTIDGTSGTSNIRGDSMRKYVISFRAAFYNLFNRHYYKIQGYGGLRATIDAGNFGQILGVQDSPRQEQFAIRLDF